MTEPVPGAVHDGAGDLTLPVAPGRIRRWWAGHPRAADVLLILFWGGPEVAFAIGGVWRADSSVTNTVVVLVLVGIAVAGIPFRRTRPQVTVVAGLVSVVAMAWTEAGYSPMLFAAFAACVWWSRAAGWWSIAVASVLGAAATAVRVWVVAPGSGGLGEVFAPALPAFLVIAVLIGTTTGDRRRYTEALIDRARQLARERDQQARLAAAAERARIAREMHDIVSHSVTVMVRLAEGAAAGLPDDDPSATAMRGVADVGRSAMTDMRRMLGVLSEPGAGSGGADAADSLAPQPAVRDLPQLVDGFRALGTPVTLEVAGGPPDDDALQLAVYRIVQEALTNVVRYAPRARAVTATVTTSSDEVVVTVTDDARRTAPAPQIGTGRGLVGIRERVHALGGSVHAGPRPADGWEVRATIPVRKEA
ncbi:sensor histidine kinase [Curtobacterium sp. BH-2-1-1]|uniref:sensor histidine kinase n=1 Tax=Curtobacterium sp. BH-2-1-1 TaxID=1905847 RepID=UPI000A9D96E2|nr:histidine kinase [Curtobacterium sp. BH-2-1-1]